MLLRRMRLSAYLSPTRHGVYYFRWRLPIVLGESRQTLRVSLRTKCPDRASDLARYMASFGILIRDNKDLAKFNRSEVRVMVRDYFKAQLERYATVNSAVCSQRITGFGVLTDWKL